MKRDIRPFEGAEQLDLVGVEPGEQPVEGGKAGGGGEQPVKAGLKLPLSARSGIAAICLQVGVEPPHPRPDPRARLPLAVVEADQLVDEPLGVDPAQRVRADVELAGVVADDDGILEQAMGDHVRRLNLLDYFTRFSRLIACRLRRG